MVTLTQLADIGKRHDELRLLVLVGSRATGTQHPGSDWDLGYLGGDRLDVGTLVSEMAAALGTDDVDLVDLAAASAVLRRDAAAHGRLIWERASDTFQAFQIEAAMFWCDVETVIREAHEDILRAAMRP